MDEDECDLAENLGKDAGRFNCLIGCPFARYLRGTPLLDSRRTNFRGLFANLYWR